MAQQRPHPSRRTFAMGSQHDRQHEANLQRRRDDRSQQHQHRDHLLPVLPQMLGASDHGGGGRAPDDREARASEPSSRPRRAARPRASARACGSASPHGGATAPCRTADSVPTRPAQAPAIAAADRSVGTRRATCRRPVGCAPGYTNALPANGQVGLWTDALWNQAIRTEGRDRRGGLRQDYQRR